MDTTLKMLTDVIKSEVCGAPLSLSQLTEAEARALFELSSKQGLAHLVGDVLCRNSLLPDGEAKIAFEKDAFLVFGRYALMQRETQTLCSIFEEAKIPYIPLKGTVIREYYPTPWMRNSADIDILVKPEDHERAKAVLVENGYIFHTEHTHDASFDSPAGIRLELHYCLVEKSYLPHAAELLGSAWEYAHPRRDGVFHYEFSDDFFYLYHVAHMAKHYLHGGCGIRPFLDLWVLGHRVPHDTSARFSLLDACKLASFAQAAEALAEHWFGNGEKNHTTEIMAHFVLAGGVYGSRENLATVRSAKRGGKISHIWGLFFTPYDVLKHSYPVLKKHKWLYPFCQVHRWFKRLFQGCFKRLFRTMFLLDAKDKDDPQRITKEHLKELGF